MKCSSCGGTRENNILQHKPICPSYVTATFFREHPDMVFFEGLRDRYYPDDVWGAPPPKVVRVEQQWRRPVKPNRGPTAVPKPSPPPKPPEPPNS